MTLPNSLFSNMIITICSKFGTRGFGVAVRVGEGVGVNVAVAGTSVEVSGARVGVMDASVGVLEQATSKTISSMQKSERFRRFMGVSLKNKFEINLVEI